MSKRSTNLVKHVKFLVQAGAIEKPKWLDIVEKCPPIPTTKGHRPRTISFPEDSLYGAYFAKHPEAKLEPVDLSSFEPPSARRFVLRQQELIDSGMNKREAFAKVEDEFVKAAGESRGSRPSVLATVQAEEEACLRRGLLEFRARHPGFKFPAQIRRQQQGQRKAREAVTKAAAEVLES